MIGKIKTTMQMIALTVLLATNPQGPVLLWGLGLLLLNVAAVLTLWSMVTYLRNAWPVLKSGLK